jgi:hypothetical protein
MKFMKHKLLYISDLPTFPGNISDFDYEITFSARFVDAFNENAVARIAVNLECTHNPAKRRGVW